MEVLESISYSGNAALRSTKAEEQEGLNNLEGGDICESTVLGAIKTDEVQNLNKPDWR